MTFRRGVGLVFALIGAAVCVSAAGVAVMYLAMSRGPSVPGSATLVLRPGGALAEVAPDDIVGQVLGRDAATLRGLVDSLRLARQDPRVTHVLLRPGSLELPYWAKVQELRDAVLDFRKSGKKVTAFLEYGGDREYYLATAADRVYLLPSSPLDLTGVASYEVFLRGALDAVGARADFLHIGEYKSAPNQLTEKTFTPEHREMSESLNREAFEQLVRGLAEARKKSPDEIRALVDEGPFVASRALEAGLVDGLAYEDQLDDLVPEMRATDRGERLIEGKDYQQLRPAAVGVRTGARVAVVYAVGTIVSGKSGFDGANGATLGSDTMVEQLRRVTRDPSIRAVVLRIDSPGGSSVASDVIWRELTVMKQAHPERPLVVSMSDLAASGGYYIATPGDVIVAQPGTLTGSIGIFAGKFVIDGTLEKLGVNSETVLSGADADIYSPFAPFSERQRGKLDRFMRDFYDGFLQKVAQARKTTPEAVDRVARGRVWTGAQARERGLVDQLGGLDVAVAVAKERAKIPAGEQVELVTYPARRSFYEVLSEQVGGSRLGAASIWRAFGGGDEARAVAGVTAPARLFRRGEPLALMPFAFLR